MNFTIVIVLIATIRSYEAKPLESDASTENSTTLAPIEEIKEPLTVPKEVLEVSVTESTEIDSKKHANHENEVNSSQSQVNKTEERVERSTLNEMNNFDGLQLKLTSDGEADESGEGSSEHSEPSTEATVKHEETVNTTTVATNHSEFSRAANESVEVKQNAQNETEQAEEKVSSDNEEIKKPLNSEQSSIEDEEESVEEPELEESSLFDDEYEESRKNSNFDVIDTKVRSGYESTTEVGSAQFMEEDSSPTEVTDAVPFGSRRSFTGNPVQSYPLHLDEPVVKPEEPVMPVLPKIPQNNLFTPPKRVQPEFHLPNIPSVNGFPIIPMFDQVQPVKPHYQAPPQMNFPPTFQQTPYQHPYPYAQSFPAPVQKMAQKTLVNNLRSSSNFDLYSKLREASDLTNPAGFRFPNFVHNPPQTFQYRSLGYPVFNQYRNN